MTASRHEVSLSSGALLDQQTNELDIELTNLQSADAGNENFGWTGLATRFARLRRP